MQEIQLKMPKTLDHMELTSKDRRQTANRHTNNNIVAFSDHKCDDKMQDEGKRPRLARVFLAYGLGEGSGCLDGIGREGLSEELAFGQRCK